MVKTIYLSIQNGGDGSAYAHFFEDEDCAFMDQRLMEEGWGEDCVQELKLSSDTEITVLDRQITSRENFIKKLQVEVDSEWTEHHRKNQLENAIKLLSGAL